MRTCRASVIVQCQLTTRAILLEGEIESANVNGIAFATGTTVEELPVTVPRPPFPQLFFEICIQCPDPNHGHLATSCQHLGFIPAGCLVVFQDAFPS